MGKDRVLLRFIPFLTINYANILPEILHSHRAKHNIAHCQWATLKYTDTEINLKQMIPLHGHKEYIHVQIVYI